MIWENGKWITDDKEEGRNKLWDASEEQTDDLEFFVEIGKEYNFCDMTLSAVCSKRLEDLMEVISKYIMPYSKLRRTLPDGQTEKIDPKREFIAWLDFASKKDKMLKGETLEGAAQILQAYFGDFTGRMQCDEEALEVDNKPLGKMPFNRFRNILDYQKYVNLLNFDMQAKNKAVNNTLSEGLVIKFGGEVELPRNPNQ